MLAKGATGGITCTCLVRTWEYPLKCNLDGTKPICFLPLWNQYQKTDFDSLDNIIPHCVISLQVQFWPRNRNDMFEQVKWISNWLACKSVVFLIYVFCVTLYNAVVIKNVQSYMWWTMWCDIRIRLIGLFFLRFGYQCGGCKLLLIVTWNYFHN